MNGCRRTIAPVVPQFHVQVAGLDPVQPELPGRPGPVGGPAVRPYATSFWISTACSSESAVMMPSTGPKYSTQVVLRAARSASSLTPRDHSLPSSSCFGSTTRDSPRSRVVRALSSLPFGGSIIRTHLRGRIGRGNRPSATSPRRRLVAEPLRGAGRPDQDDQRGGRALLAGMAERGHDVLHREVDVRAGVR